MKHALVVFLIILSLSSLSLANTKVVPTATQGLHAPMRHYPTPTKKLAKPETTFYQKLAYDSQKNEWSISARLIQIKNVALFGQPSQVGQVEYLSRPCRTCTTTPGYEGKLAKMWIVISFPGDVSFYLSDKKLVPGDKILLSLSGPYVSKSGVNWYACPSDDEYCHRAGLADGNGPTALDWDNVEINSSNELIWSGSGPSGWWGGALCWKITVLDDDASRDSVGKNTSLNHKTYIRE